MFSIGVRYDLAKLSDLKIEQEWQYDGFLAPCSCKAHIECSTTQLLPTEDAHNCIDKAVLIGATTNMFSRNMSRSLSVHSRKCQFDKQARELGSTWFADLGPPFGVMYCFKCECLPVQKKRRVVAKVRCRNIKNECPEPTCDTPVLLPGRCCKTCPGDVNYSLPSRYMLCVPSAAEPFDSPSQHSRKQNRSKPYETIPHRNRAGHRFGTETKATRVLSM
ncbi:unnamed protein product [Chilo suppressalis]|uniref:VWFC domain-containing protein n=1 Tax=Chilo suppressalis TaxID=168631 RepID=A0ABN8AZD8_CHISP|nr:unnamed protein product [Chilo suppressalis]